MALADIMSVEMSAKYMDSSSSSSLSSDSDDLSSSSSSSAISSSSSNSESDSDTPRASVKKKTGSRGRAGKKMNAKLSDYEDDSDLDSATSGGRKKITKPAAPRRSPTKSNGKAKTVSKAAPISAPPSVPPPPPPPPPAAPVDDSSSNSSFSDSSSSDSSDLSDSETPMASVPAPPPPPPVTGGSTAAAAPVAAASSRPPKRRAATKKKKVSGVSPSSLKVTLKLPPGFIAKNGGGAVLNSSGANSNRPKLNFQVTDTNAKTAAKRVQTSTTAVKKAKPAAGSRSTKKKQPAGRGQGSFAAQGAVPVAQMNGALPSVPLVPVGSPILPKLIPTGPTVPSGEIRGAKELSLVAPALVGDNPEETIESNIPAHFNDPYAHGGDILRLLDMFFFCDENGKAISLEILDRPKDQRPKIMGFGTVVEHLPLVERPLPIKPILASPAFPSRSKKRPRADSSSSTPAKSPASKSRARHKAAGYKNESKRAKVEDERIYQVDGEFDEEEDDPSSFGERSIFQRSNMYRFPSPFHPGQLSQLDGQSDSDSGGSNLTSDDEDIRSGRSGSGAGSDNDSEILSSATSSSSGSGSDNDMNSGNSSSSGGSDAECGEGMTPTTRRPSSMSSATVKTEHLPQRDAESKRPATDRVSRRPSTRVDSRNAGLPYDVVELMRTDQAVEVNAKGTPDELNLMECSFRHPPTYARARVWLPEITDWCLDYAEGDPTLWVVTPHAWYKIAGPLSGLLAHSAYRQTFKHVRYLFEASYLVAYVLKEWLPINKKVSYRATLQQIIELSLMGRYRVSAWFLVKNYPFIRAQISNLFPDKDTYLESMFFKQLHRLHENFTLREARHRKEMADREVRRAKRENERLQRKQRVEHERQRVKDEREEERKIKEEELKYPVEDRRLLEGDAVNTNNLPVSCSSLKGVEGPLLGELIMAWQTICTFKDFVGLQSISLEALVECITARCDEGTHVGLTRIFMAFLRVILSEKSFMSLLDDLVVEGNIKVSDLFVNSERTYGTCERAYGDMLNAVTWQEILRQLMSKDLGIDPSIGHVEPLVGCEIVRQTLYMQNNSGPFNFPVDMSLKGLEDYAQLIKNPMDLGTIKKKIDSGGYEGPDGYEKFAEDIRLVWDNAVLYNGEESEVGRAALALSDVFEQDYERFVVGRVRANQSRIEGCKKAKQTLQDPSAEELKSFKYSDVVYGLYCSEFHELPTAYKIGALSWICSEFLTLSSIRTYMSSQVEQEMLIYRNYRKRAADLDSRRKHSDRMRRERDNAFRRDCANQGIHPNSHNVFSEGIKRRHEFIGKFFEDLQAEKIEDEKNLELEKKNQAEEMASELSSVVIRESPLGRDRYHNAYYMFKHDTKPRLFIERGDSGDFVVCSSKDQLMKILEWLNPKGVRELDLLTRLQEVKDQLLSGFGEEEAKHDCDTAAEIVWNTKGGIELQMFPLPGGAIKSEVMTITDADRVIKSHNIARKMLLCLKQHLENTNTLPASWEGAQTWSTRVEEAKSFKEQLDLFAELENAAVQALTSGVETIRPSWQRKRHEWRLALEGSCTYAQLVLLLHLLLEEFINVEAFMDLHIRLDRREWLKLRPKETRNFIPEVERVVVYFGDGHALALKEDEKSKRKRFTQKSDTPVRNAIVICTVEKVSYHHGGGDPYALAVLKPISDTAQHECIREPETLLCPLPSREQRLARVFLRVLAKLKMLADAGPFLEPVSEQEFPQYKEIILHPMDLGEMTVKASKLEYKNAAEFMTDLRLMRDNCQLFCEGRFPTLPPLAHNLVYVADGQIKKWGKEIRACEETSVESSSVEKEITSSSEKSVAKQEEFESEKAAHTELPTRSIVTILRLENRLPEYVVDVSRYSWAVNRTWSCGEKFRMLFRNPQGQPGEFYGGVTAGSIPFNKHGMLPWESLRITWDEDDGSDDNRINPWEAEFPRGGNRA
ncbi:hypothetical protein PHYPSEUDO_004490 [Phytophthora pseudosyringae]|uniref:Bromo domain-containing protein n=1 Tax=Phytophthora pseudosyringae TaxID=221518 RepID=A0A8T1WIK6_9STRA|nr:hypothetical protein PHYPSEUDO_004490 [Phytophthora pseudosyringae]